MHAYRKTRLGWAAISNGQLLFVALLVVWRAGGEIRVALVALTVAALCVLGFVLEIAVPGIAAVLNVALPTTLGLLMLTAGLWLPLLGEPTEGAEGISVPYVLLLLSLAISGVVIHAASSRNEHCGD